MYFVYILKSQQRKFTYVGLTKHLRGRLNQHQQGDSPVTRPYRPLELLWYCSFPRKEIAARFEKYLKTGSGRAFTSKHFTSSDDEVTT